MENAIQNKRKNYYIKKEFQRAFIIKFCVLVILGAAVSGAIIYLASSGTATTAFENSRIRIKSTADFILPAVLLTTAVVAVLVCLATIIVTLYASHKIAGPLYRIEKDLGKVLEGDLRVKFNLRKNDQLQALANMIELLIAGLRHDVLEIQGIKNELKTILEELRAKGGNEGLAIAGRKLQEIEKKLSKYSV